MQMKIRNFDDLPPPEEFFGDYIKKNFNSDCVDAAYSFEIDLSTIDRFSWDNPIIFIVLHGRYATFFQNKSYEYKEYAEELLGNENNVNEYFTGYAPFFVMRLYRGCKWLGIQPVLMATYPRSKVEKAIAKMIKYSMKSEG